MRVGFCVVLRWIGCLCGLVCGVKVDWLFVWGVEGVLVTLACEGWVLVVC